MGPFGGSLTSPRNQTMFSARISSCYRKPSFRRPRLEVLEDRVVLSASKVFGGLEFTTTGTFNTSNHLVTSSSPVQVGVAPAGGGTFTPVLSLDKGARFTDNDATGTFTTTGTVSGIQGTQSLLLLDAHQHTFTAPGLLADNYYSLPAGDTNTPHLDLGGGKLTVTGLHLASGELDLQGSIAVPTVTGLTLDVQGTDHVAIDATGPHLVGPDSIQNVPMSFTRGGL